MPAISSLMTITGPVKDVDPQGFALVAGITFAITPAQLPARGQIVKIEASLDETQTPAGEPTIWTATSIVAFSGPAATPAQADLQVPHATAHHNTSSTQTKPAAIPAATAPSPSTPAAPKPQEAAGARRFGAPSAQPAQTTTHRPVQAAQVGRFGAPAAATRAPAASMPSKPVGRFGGVSAMPARQAAPAQAARPPFVAAGGDLDDGIPF